MADNGERLASVRTHLGNLLSADWDKAALWSGLGVLGAVALVWLGQNAMVCCGCIGASCSQLMAIARPNVEDAKLSWIESRRVERAFVIVLGLAFFCAIGIVVAIEWLLQSSDPQTSLLALGVAAG